MEKRGSIMISLQCPWLCDLIYILLTNENFIRNSLKGPWCAAHIDEVSESSLKQILICVWYISLYVSVCVSVQIRTGMSMELMPWAVFRQRIWGFLMMLISRAESRFLGCVLIIVALEILGNTDCLSNMTFQTCLKCSNPVSSAGNQPQFHVWWLTASKRWMMRLFYKLSVLWNNSCYLLPSNTTGGVLCQTVIYLKKNPAKLVDWK